MIITDSKLLETSDEEKLLRQTEFVHLKDICYLDYTGAGIYSQSQMNLIGDQLKTSLLSHPHGSSVLSDLCVAEVDQIRSQILQYFDTDSDQYSIIFTSGATSAIKTVSEYFHFNEGSFVYLTDNHTSVLGMRELVKTPHIHKLSSDEARKVLNQSAEDCTTKPCVQNVAGPNSLFVYPAQSNFSGVKYPLSWCSTVTTNQSFHQQVQSPNSNWYTLLDAATYCTSNKLSLNHDMPDFVCISFYKMFGYPTGLGALLVKNSSAHVLNKTYYGGGTVKIALANENFHVKKDGLQDKFEDGTVNYLGIISLKHGFNLKNSLWKDKTNVFKMAQYTYLFLKHLYYPNQRPAVELYHDNDYSNRQTQGSIVNFNLLREDGTYYGYSEVQNLANLKKIQLRTGCHCNPGACQRFLGLSDDKVKYHFDQGHVCGDDKDIIEGKPTGSVRVSYGYASNWDDVKYFLSFVKQYFASQSASISTIDTFPSNVNHEVVCKLDSMNLQPEKEPIIEETTGNGKLEKIFLYPVKACGFYEVKGRWELNASGLKYDRQWMIVNQSGVALTQKLEKNLCFIHPNFDFTSNVMILTYKNSESSIEVLLKMNETDEKNVDNLCRSKVCNDKITGYDCGDSVALWLDEQLNHTGLRLIRLKQRTSKRNLNSFSNMGQYLLITIPSVQAQLKELGNKFNAMFQLDSFVHRFRSNFVLSGSFHARAENDWDEVRIETNEGLLSFQVKSQCTRCQYIYVDQTTGITTDIPLGITKFGVYINNNFALDNDKTLYLSVGDKAFCKNKIRD
uniref:Molybdenum cofactor sulfurase n=1 Tax=Cacopsylla melanoneura TaxID=428564 RepID=A0A8D8Q5V3_9HEMI